MAADVYSIDLHKGRGGWTWYTGSAGWMYQLVTESLLGLLREGGSLRFAPCLPEAWEPFTVRYRYKATDYTIRFVQGGEPETITIVLDNITQPGDRIALADDGREHYVEVRT